MGLDYVACPTALHISYDLNPDVVRSCRWHHLADSAKGIVKIWDFPLFDVFSTSLMAELDHALPPISTLYIRFTGDFYLEAQGTSGVVQYRRCCKQGAFAPIRSCRCTQRPDGMCGL